MHVEGIDDRHPTVRCAQTKNRLVVASYFNGYFISVSRMPHSLCGIVKNGGSRFSKWTT